MIKDFIKMSHYAGMREDLVQAGGGNSAYKISPDKMIIKASGYPLAELSEEDGYSVVNPKIITAAFSDQAQPDNLTEEDAKKILRDAWIDGKRPSIETFLHAIAGKYTLHTHPVAVNVLACRKQGVKELQQLFPQAWIIPYATPGIELAKVFFQTAKASDQKKPDVIFLLNHGLLISGDSAQQVMERTEQTVRKIEQALGLQMQEYHYATELWNLFADGIVWNVTDVHVRLAYQKLHGLWEHVFCPDCVVFLGKKIWETDMLEEKKLEAFRDVYGEPSVILYRGYLYLHAPSVKKALEMQSVLSFSAQVMLAQDQENYNLLSEQEQDFLLHWEAETYRKR